MDLSKIISIAGKPGLYRLLKQSRNGFIVESIETGKKMSVSSANNVSLLTNVAMYSQTEEVPLGEIFARIARKENLGSTISHKVSGKELHAYFKEILMDYDESRVYDSDLKKLYQWYNILQAANLIELSEDKEPKEEEAQEKPATADKKKPAAKKKPTPKKGLNKEK